MTKLIFIRGASGVGKSTITKQVLKILKTKHKLDCAYISEDNFRKEMQFKYKAKDLIAHKNSVILIKSVITKLLSIDSYDYIFIEGLFRHVEMLDDYISFSKENNFEYLLFQLICDENECLRRDLECRFSKGINPNDNDVYNEINSKIPNEAQIIDTNNSIEKSVAEIIAILLKK